jgi:hypothetical protein
MPRNVMVGVSVMGHVAGCQQIRRSASPRRSTLVLIAFSFAIPFLPFAGLFGFVPLPGALLAAVAVIAALYVGATELAKRWFYRLQPS